MNKLDTAMAQVEDRKPDAEPIRLTLENPPEGYETAAVYKMPKRNDHVLASTGKVMVAISDLQFGGLYIVLTPKKNKYWRLDPVVTFEEATINQIYSLLALGFHREEGLGFYRKCDKQVSGWLTMTEREA